MEESHLLIPVEDQLFGVSFFEDEKDKLGLLYEFLKIHDGMNKINLFQHDLALKWILN